DRPSGVARAVPLGFDRRALREALHGHPCRTDGAYSWSKALKILYVAMKHDYGQPERGYSFEHHTFFDGLSALGHELIYFDFMSLLDEFGPAEMNRHLFDVAQGEKPHLIFTVLFKDDLDPAI